MWTLFETYSEESSYLVNGEESGEKVPDLNLLLNFEFMEDSSLHLARRVIGFFLFVIFCSLLGVMIKEFKCTRKLTRFIPASCLLVLIGFLVESLVYVISRQKFVKLELLTFEDIFILPIILHASYNLYATEKLFRGIKSMLFFSFGSLIFTVLLTSIILRYVFTSFLLVETSITHCFIIAICISIVDPVVLLSLFKEPTKGHLQLLFGQSLINYGIAKELIMSLVNINAQPGISTSQVLLGLGSVVTNIFLGSVIGFIHGILSAFLIRFTHDMKWLEPIITLGTVIASYFTSKMFGFSGVFSVLICGFVQARYTFANMDPVSKMGTRKIIQNVISLSEILLFLFLGSHIEENTPWILSAFLCGLRFVVITFATLMLCYLLNAARRNHISFPWQLFIIFSSISGPLNFTLILHYSGSFDSQYHDAVLVSIMATFFISSIASRCFSTRLGLRESYKETNICDSLLLVGEYEEPDIFFGDVLESNKPCHCCLSLERKVFELLVKDQRNTEEAFRYDCDCDFNMILSKLEKHENRLPEGMPNADPDDVKSNRPRIRIKHKDPENYPLQ